MEKARLFCEIDGVKYYDWTVYWNKDKYWAYPANYNLVFTYAISGNFEESCINDLLDDTFVPAVGSEIHVVSGCPVGMTDIRKNYTIKRKADDGCCNVFSPLSVNCRWLSCSSYSIVPSRQAIFISESRYPRDVKREKIALQNEINNAFPDLTDLERNEISFVENDLNLKYGCIPEAYLDLLQGKLQKPCISYKKLQFKTENELTQDILYLVYRAGKEKWNHDAGERFKIQLCALNEHNWRDYPGTVNMLFTDILNPRKSAYCMGMLGTSYIPKAAKELSNSMIADGIQFKSQKDIEMAQRFLKYIMGIPEDLQFTTIQTINKKFSEANINMNAFYRCFNNMVKLIPKKVENES